MADYLMVVEIPIKGVPEDITIQEAKIKSEQWLKLRIEDAVMLEFKED